MITAPRAVLINGGLEAKSVTHNSVSQVHYASVDHIPQEGDDSGVFLQYTEQVR